MFDILNIGNKARSLIFLKTHNFNVPPFIIIPGSYINALLQDGSLQDNLIKQLDEFDMKIYSVRSSPEYSMPGVMQTILNVETYDKLFELIQQVYDSYNSKLSILYRTRNNIPDAPPSVIIQKMVFGNSSGYSGSGVAYSRNNFGDAAAVIEFKGNHQGDVIVSNQIDINNYDVIPSSLEHEISQQLRNLEKLYKFPVEIEFTVENGIYYILQCRELKFTDSVLKYKIYTDLYNSAVITEKKYLDLIDALDLNSIRINSGNVIYTGYPASGGIVTYNSINPNIYFADKIDNSILDVLDQYSGIITNEGSLTSHISIVCRNMNIPYIILPDVDLYMLSNTNFTMDGFTGNIYDECDIIKITKENIKDYV